MSDLIKKPAHYTYSEFEPRDIIPAWTEHSSEAWLVGAAIKYLCRSGAPLAVRKAPEVEDWKKAREVLNVAIMRAEPDSAADSFESLDRAQDDLNEERQRLQEEAGIPAIGPPQGRDCGS